MLAQGLAALATGFFEMGHSEAEVREKLLRQWTGLQEPGGLFAAAATEVGGQPQPLVESAEKTERMRDIRTMLGVQGAQEQLLAAMNARDLLERLGREFG